MHYADLKFVIQKSTIYDKYLLNRAAIHNKIGIKIIIGGRFKDDLNGDLDYISQNLDNPSASKRIVSKLSNIVSLLKENPYTFPLYHDDVLAKEGLRYTIINNYLLFYKVHEKDQTVELSRFIFGSRNITDIF